jgi:hypothetical protein
MLIRKNIKLLKGALTAVLALFVVVNAFASPVDQSVAIEKTLINSSINSQKKINRFAEQTVDMAFEYKSTLRIIEQLQAYNTQLEQVIDSQEKEMVSIQNQMDTIDTTERGVVPLMNEMIASLEKFVELDLPFDKEARTQRVEKLKGNMIRADLSNSEKYRHILVAYQTEIAYGESFGTYKGLVTDSNGQEIQVDFLRAGRVLLTYVTLDGKNAGYYNAKTGNYESLDPEYIRGIELAIKMANRQAAPELLKLPVPATQGAN